MISSVVIMWMWYSSSITIGIVVITIHVDDSMLLLYNIVWWIMLIV